MELLKWQEASLYLIRNEGASIISAPRGQGKTTLGLLAARIVAEDGGCVAFVSEFIRSWSDYYGDVFSDVKPKSKLSVRRKLFDGTFKSGGTIDLIAPNMMDRNLSNWTPDYVVIDNGDLMNDLQGDFIERKIRSPGILILGYLVGASPWFKKKFVMAAEDGYTSFAFHEKGNHYVDR